MGVHRDHVDASQRSMLFNDLPDSRNRLNEDTKSPRNVWGCRGYVLRDQGILPQDPPLVGLFRCRRFCWQSLTAPLGVWR